MPSPKRRRSKRRRVILPLSDKLKQLLDQTETPDISTEVPMANKPDAEESSTKPRHQQ